MKVGIRKIEYISRDNVSDWGYLPAGSSFAVSGFISGTWQQLPFTPETGNLVEEWHYDENGRYSDLSFTASVRAAKESYRGSLQKLQGMKALFRITTIAGKKYIIGSKEFLPTFTYSDTLSGQSSNEFSIRIACQSLHGALFDSE